MALSVRPSVRGHFSFPTFFVIFGATALKLDLLLCSKKFQFQVID
jgi:hypothetical protein